MFDPGQYRQAGLEYTWRACLPIWLQTLAVLSVVAALGRVARTFPRAGSRSGRSHPGRRVALLAMSQLLLFLLLEATERAAQREPFADGLLASGFAFELLFAIGAALLLLGLGSLVARIVRSLRRRPATTAIDGHIGRIPSHVAPAHAVIVAGDVRAPPLALA